jgi:hypothetical protein
VRKKDKYEYESNELYIDELIGVSVEILRENVKWFHGEVRV